MYKDRGSKAEMGAVDRKRINEALDKQLERSSPSTSKGLNGKDKDRLSAQSIISTTSGKQPSDQRDSRTASLSKNRCSDGQFIIFSLLIIIFSIIGMLCVGVFISFCCCC